MSGMVERRPWLDALSHAVLLLGVLVVAFPLYVAWVASTQSAAQTVQMPMSLLPGSHGWDNYLHAWNGSRSQGNTQTPVAHMLWVSLVCALAIALGKIAISLLSAFALVYFRFAWRGVFFWAIFLTLMLPVEVRIGPTYQVVADLGLLNSYVGLTLPLMASATATFLFRQFFLTLPDELLEAALLDGAGPLRFFKDFVLPLSGSNMAALFVIQFVYGWNQYLWPLLMTTQEDKYPIVIGIKQMIGTGESQTEWNLVMATTLLALAAPALVVVLMQKWLVRGVTDTEK